MSLPDTCGRCGGAGAVSAGKGKPCPMCGGTGKVKGGRGLFGNNLCPQCGGTGQATEICPDCHGDGAVTKQRKLSDVKIPAGVADGQRIRLAGQGAGGGDLFLKVKVTAARRSSSAPAMTCGRICWCRTRWRPWAARPVWRHFRGPQSAERPAGHTERAVVPPDRPGDAQTQRRRRAATSMRGSKMTVPKDLSPRERDLLTELAKLRQDAVKVRRDRRLSRWHS